MLLVSYKDFFFKKINLGSQTTWDKRAEQRILHVSHLILPLRFMSVLWPWDLTDSHLTKAQLGLHVFNKQV